MKVLFVLSGNPPKGGEEKPKALVKNAKHQGDSLIRMGINIEYFYIKGRGVLGYLKNIPSLIRTINQGNYDVIHAHYSLTAFLTSIVIFKKPIIVSLMGSDVHSSKFGLSVIRFFIRYRWKKVIVKSVEMAKKLNSDNCVVVPNGVDLELFKPIEQEVAREELGLPRGKKIILFVADINRPEKNFQLAEKAIQVLDDEHIILLPIRDIPHYKVSVYLNASDVLLLTSLWEGSVNSVKEAMACNVKIVSTDVGDVKKNISGLNGCYITSFEPKDVAEKINLSIDYAGAIGGRERLKDLGLDAETQNNKIISLYKDLV